MRTPYVIERTNRDATRMSEAQAAVQTGDSDARNSGAQTAAATATAAAADDTQSSWAFVGISPEARRAAEMAAEASGMEVDIWLSQLIKYKSAMELRGREAVSLDDAIFQMAPKAEETQAAGAKSATPASAPAAAAAPATAPAKAPVRTQAANDSSADKSSADASATTDSSGEETLVLNTKADGGAVRTTPMGGHAPAAQAGPVAGPAASTAKPAGQQTSAPAQPQKPVEAQPASTPVNGLHDGLAEDAPRRQMMPTDALRASRLSAIGKADETEIQHVLDNWRDARSLEPLVVRPVAGERNAFEVIAGVERWYAARRAHVREVPVILHEASDDEAIRLAMSMRLKRGPMSPLAEANTYLSLMSEAHMSTEQVARLVGKPPAHIATMVRVLNLPRSVRQMLERGEITALHARALLDAPNPDASAREVIARRLDIYQTEQLVRATAVRSERAEKVSIADVDLDIAHESDEAAELATGKEAGSGEDEAGPDLQAQEFVEELGGGDFVGEAGEDGLAIIDEDEFDPALIDESGFRAANDTHDPDAQQQTQQQEQDTDPQQDDPDASSGASDSHDEDTVSTELLERRLATKLGVKVAITERHSVGVISLHYSSREELSDIVARLNNDPDH